MSDKPLTVRQLQGALDRLVRRSPKAGDMPVALEMSGGIAEWLDHLEQLPVRGFNPDGVEGSFVSLTGREGPMS